MGGNRMKIRFTTPCIYKTGCTGEVCAGEGCANDGAREFGCASFGFAGAPDPAAEGERTWKGEIKGQAFFGTLEAVLAAIPEKCCIGTDAGNGCIGRPWQAGIVLFGNCGGENDFIHALYEKTGCPLTGGAAACDPVSGASGLVAGGSQAAVYMICDPDHEVRVESKNVHGNLLGVHKIGFTDPRVLDTIDGEDAVLWYTERREEYGFSAKDFEHMTLSDLNGVNAHMSMNGKRLVSGRDLCDEMILRYVDKGDVYPQMNTFYNDPNALVFGCAGLKGILEQDIMLDTMGMFMFGEVATMDGKPEFGNLMLSKVVIE